MNLFGLNNVYTQTLRNVLIIIAVLTVAGFVLRCVAERENKFGIIAGYLLKLVTIGAAGIFLYFTVLNRGTHIERAGDLIPFHSYVQAIKAVKPDYLGDGFYVIIFNLALTYPLGFFLCLSHDRVKIGKTILTLAILSILAETIQFIFALGYYEVDDVINNVLGGTFGYLVAFAFKRIIQRFDNK